MNDDIHITVAPCSVIRKKKQTVEWIEWKKQRDQWIKIVLVHI